MSRRNDIIEVCTHLATVENLKVTVTESAKGALIAGVSAFIGALLAGPAGLAVGGTVGAVTAAVNSRGKFRPVVEVIKYDMTEMQRHRLADSVHRVLGNIQTTEIMFLITLLTSNQSLKELVIREIGSFLMNEMSMSIQ